MRVYSPLENIISYTIPMLVLVVLTPIFVEFFGPYLLRTKSQYFEIESKLIFYVVFVVGQIIHPLISSINSGLIVLPMAEVTGITGVIATKCLGTTGPLVNTLLCIVVACIFTFIFCILIYATNQGKHLSKIPLGIIDALLITTGFRDLIFGLYSFKGIDSKKVMILSAIASLLITATAIVILKQTGHPYFIILFILALIGSTNILKAIYPETDFVKMGIFLSEHGKPLDLPRLIDQIIHERVQISSIKDNFISIMGLSLSPIISILMTLPFYSKRFGMDINYNDEVKNFGLGTLFHIFFPASISCSGSVLFKTCGAETRMHSVVAGIGIIGLYFVYKHITPLLSIFVLALVPEFIGISIVMGYLSTLKKYTLGDKIVLGIMLVVAFISGCSAPILLAIGIAISIISSYYISGSIGGEITVTEQDMTLILKPMKSLTHLNIDDFTSHAKALHDLIVFDFTDVKYVDYTANKELSAVIDSILKGGRGVEIVGKPYNMNERLIAECKPREIHHTTTKMSS